MHRRGRAHPLLGRHRSRGEGDARRIRRWRKMRMKDDFSGKGAPIDATGLQSALDLLDLLALDAACLWSVIGVETSGHGFLADRRPVILFERPEFSAPTGQGFDARNPDLSNPVPGG